VKVICVSKTAQSEEKEHRNLATKQFFADLNSNGPILLFDFIMRKQQHECEDMRAKVLVG
jgi:hypothetical protein